jgi:hypothetical protein
MSVAELPDGTRLPIIDTTHPVFRVDDGPDVVARWREQVATSPASKPMPPAAVPAAPMPDLLRRMFAPSSPFLDGLATYLLKLGPDALPASFDTGIERRLVSTPNAMSLRVRLQQIADLMAQLLAGVADQRAIRLMSIGGGTGIEAMNAMIIHAKQRARAGCQFTVEVLDLKEDGIAFGSAALTALLRPDGPLAGATGSFAYVPYSWDEPDGLRVVTAMKRAEGEFTLASSEGGLFEYASDEAILGNLRALREGGDIDVAGSVIREDEAGQAMVARSPFPLHARGLRGLEALARHAGYRVAASREGVASDQFLLST